MPIYRIRRVVGLIVLAVCLSASTTSGEEFEATVGSHNVIFPDGYHGLRGFPDEPLSVLSRRPFIYLMVANDSTVLMSGRTLETATPKTVVLAPGKQGEFDDGYAGIGTVFKQGATLFGFYHAEEHFGEIHNPRLRACNPTINYWSIGLAVSTDRGRTFRKRGQILSSSTPKGTDKRRIQGVGVVSVCPEHTGKYLYAYYADVSGVNDRDVVCMARCPVDDVGKPNSWRKLHKGAFREPGLGGKDDPVLEDTFQFAGQSAPHVAYIPSMKKYIMLCDVISPLEVASQTKKRESGIYLAHSDDGVAWSVPQPVFNILTVPVEGREYGAHPGLLIEKSDSETVEGWLVYTYSPRYGGNSPNSMHHMARRRFRLVRTTSDLKSKLAGTRWLNSNGVSFEFTKDGRFIHGNREREWKVLNGNRVQIVFSPRHKDILEFNDATNTFKQLTRGGPMFFTGKRL